MASTPRYWGHPTRSIKLCKSVPGRNNAVLKATDGLYMNLIDKLFMPLFLKASFTSGGCNVCTVLCVLTYMMATFSF